MDTIIHSYRHSHTKRRVPVSMCITHRTHRHNHTHTHIPTCEYRATAGPVEEACPHYLWHLMFSCHAMPFHAIPISAAHRPLMVVAHSVRTVPCPASPRMQGVLGSQGQQPIPRGLGPTGPSPRVHPWTSCCACKCSPCKMLILCFPKQQRQPRTP